MPPDPPALRLIPWPILAALLASAGIVLGSAYIGRWNIDRLVAAGDSVIRTADLLDTATRVRSALHAAETGQRGYLLTGDRSFLAPYTRALEIVDKLLAKLKILVDGETQRLRVRALEKLVAEKMAELRETVAAFERGEREQALRMVQDGRGLEVMESIVALLSDMRVEDEQLRVAREELLLRQGWWSQVSGVITTAAVLAQLALCYVLIGRYVRRQRESENKLAQINEHLEDEVKRRTQELGELSRHLLTLREEDNARIARELHDELGSSLTAISMDLSWVLQRLDAGSPLAARLARASRTLAATVEGKRRIVEDLRPTMLEGLGVREAVQSYAADYAERIGVPIATDVPDELPALPQGAPIALFRIVQEALTNASRHAQAALIKVSMRLEGGRVVVEVSDDGIGIEPRAGGQARASHGLLGIRERAAALGGTSGIKRGPGGRGTVVRVTLPLADAPDPANASTG